MLAVVGTLAPDGLKLMRANLRDCSCSWTTLKTDRGARCICSHGGALIAIFHRHVEVVSPADGSVMHRLQLPAGAVWVRDRFFRIRGEWLVLAFDGVGVKLEPLPTRNSASAELIFE